MMGSNRHSAYNVTFSKFHYVMLQLRAGPFALCSFQHFMSRAHINLTKLQHGRWEKGAINKTVTLKLKNRLKIKTSYRQTVYK